MATKEITYDNYEQTLAENDMVMLVFYAYWSAHAQRFSYEYVKVSKKHPDIIFGTIDGEKYEKISSGFGVTTIPSIKFIREGITIFTYDGQLKAHELEKIIEGARAVDMDDIRRQLAEAQAAQEAAEAPPVEETPPATADDAEEPEEPIE